jgi:hypothetical protein
MRMIDSRAASASRSHLRIAKHDFSERFVFLAVLRGDYRAITIFPVKDSFFRKVVD